eukprot:GHVO01044624.1.p2 GENE.GHVO01044624.1~~GHVO01044624.1.p2  ORF type:complete len:760 (-),score=156.48 GHVO01044624.1:4105-6384(-)
MVVSSIDLKMDESSATGESRASAKSSLRECLTQASNLKEDDDAVVYDRHRLVNSPVLLSGTTCAQGSGKAIIVAVGSHSQVGQMMQQLEMETEPTPLQAKLNALARDIGFAGLCGALLTFFVLVIEYFIVRHFSAADERDNWEDIIKSIVAFIVEAITIIVVAVPEGLPLAVTLSLAYSIGKMLEDHNYVRRLAACETMGGANEICSDKTGTLTKNNMTVQAYWNGTSLIMDAQASYGNFVPWLPWTHWQALLEGIAINSSGYLSVNEQGAVEQVGSATECAMLQFLESIGTDWRGLRKKSDENSWVIFRDEFSSLKKRMTTVIDLKNGKHRVLVKGAAEKVLKLCNRRVGSSGTLNDMDKVYLDKLENTVLHRMCEECLRTLCIAYKDFEVPEDDTWKEEFIRYEGEVVRRIETDLICLGIVGIRDPVRDEVPDAVLKCQRAGISVRMVTGDNIETAKQIAKQCNIYKPDEGGMSMLGSDFRKTVGGVVCERCRTEVCDCPSGKGVENSERPPRHDVLGNIDAFKDIEPLLQVLARSQPKDKYTLVTGLKQLGSVVAVTGDGANDAPALRKADVGFAMGLCGKEVAKQAADIVLLDDNFDSIVKAVLWGRNIYDNIRRFLQFQLTVNIVAVLTALIGSLFLRGSPLCATQLLWVNLIMDSFASLALATERPTADLLDRPPHSRNDYLINRVMWRNIMCQAVYQLTVMGFTVFAGEYWLPEYEWNISSASRKEFPDFTEFSSHWGGGENGSKWSSLFYV